MVVLKTKDNANKVWKYKLQMKCKRDSLCLGYCKNLIKWDKTSIGIIFLRIWGVNTSGICWILSKFFIFPIFECCLALYSCFMNTCYKGGVQHCYYYFSKKQGIRVSCVLRSMSVVVIKYTLFRHLQDRNELGVFAPKWLSTLCRLELGHIKFWKCKKGYEEK